jgi:hypothetical protein
VKAVQHLVKLLVEQASRLQQMLATIRNTATKSHSDLRFSAFINILFATHISTQGSNHGK